MSTCPTCGSPRVSGETLCIRCADVANSPEAPTMEGLQILDVEAGDETVATDLVSALQFDERQPTRGAAGDVHVDIRPRLEYSAVPGRADSRPATSRSSDRPSSRMARGESRSVPSVARVR